VVELGKDEKNEDRTSLLETVDDLIYHMNDARLTFIVMSLSSFIMAPIAIIVTLVFAFHPALIRLMLIKEPVFGIIFMIYIIFTVISSLIWLYVGLKEYKFLSKWNERFKKYMSLKERIDRELQKE
jgi:signal transduction histidine kinase